MSKGKLIWKAAALNFVFCIGSAMAACPGPTAARVGQDALTTTLAGKTACAHRGTDRWQEYHQSGGTLIDYKKGPQDPVDPSKQVGSWSVTGDASGGTVRYDYGTGGTYMYSVYAKQDGSYSFCDAGNSELTVNLVAGSNGCGGN